METNDHHLVLGELKDYLTGAVLADTHDERYLQAIARNLVEGGGFAKAEVLKNQSLTVKAGERTARIRVSFQLVLDHRRVMVIQYAPGSLVTRRLSNLALSRAVVSYQIPVAVTTNGKDAEVIDGTSGRVLATGLSAIPSKADILQHIRNLGDGAFVTLSHGVREKAHRIVHACQVDGACPCDTDVCVIDP